MKVVILAEQLVEFHAEHHVLDGSCNCELISSVVGRVFISIVFCILQVFFDHLHLCLGLHQLSHDCFLGLYCFHLFEILNPLLQPEKLLLVTISFILCFLNHFKCIPHHVFGLLHEEVLLILFDVFVELHLALVVATKQNSNRDQHGFLLDCELLLIGDEVANQSYHAQVDQHRLLLFDFCFEVIPSFTIPIEGWSG